jgi:hypothetical protein
VEGRSAAKQDKRGWKVEVWRSKLIRAEGRSVASMDGKVARWQGGRAVGNCFWWVVGWL